MITKEKLEHHLSHLKEQHSTLDKQIDHMEDTGIFEDEELHLLKKKRLSIKDEMESVKNKIDGFAHS